MGKVFVYKLQFLSYSFMKCPRFSHFYFIGAMMVFGLSPATAGDDLAPLYASEASSPSVSTEENDSEQYSALERRIAREVIATGQMLEGDPHFGDVVARLKDRSLSLLPGSSSLTQDWVRNQLQDILPELNNAMAFAALEAATGEIARGAGRASDSLMGQAVGLTEGGALESDQLVVDAQETMWRSGLEGLKAAASVSELAALNRLELEYSLTEGGLDEYSLLTVQPLWDSADLRHNIFVQASFANKQNAYQNYDIGTIGNDPNKNRQTLNTGLSYRYITPDEQHMFGANAFFDHQWPYHHNRMSLGLDYKTSLYGVAFNKYIGLSDWRGRDDGYEEKALGGEDLEVSGRLPQAPELEVFAKGYHWGQEKTSIINPDGDDIWGYQFAAEYTPVNAFTIRSQATRDNEMDDMEGQITMRLNYRFGQGWDDLWKRPTYNLDSVVDRRFEKVRRQNEIRVQVRQDTEVTARVTFAQGANVTIGQSVAFGTMIITGGALNDAATIVFGNGAILDIGQNTQVQIDNDVITLISGLIQFTSADGGITNLVVPGGTIDLIGTDVDLRVAGGTTTLRVRDGAADFTDDTGTTRVNKEELAEASDGDGVAPVLRGEADPIFETHTTAAHTQLNLVGPAPNNPQAAPFADEDVAITGTLATGNTLTFTVPTTATVNVTGVPQLRFTLGGDNRFADYDSGTNPLVFTYDVIGMDETLSNIIAEEIEKNGGTLIGTNGAPMVRTVSGSRTGTVPDATAPALNSFARQTPAGANTDADSLTFRATFSEAVTNVDAADFTITGTTTTIDSVTDAGGGTDWDITITDGAPAADGTDGDLGNLNGTVGINLAGGQNITDIEGNALPGGEPATDETYIVSNDPCAGTPSAGDICADGTIYVGVIDGDGTGPGGNVTLYAARFDLDNSSHLTPDIMGAGTAGDRGAFVYKVNNTDSSVDECTTYPPNNDPACQDGQTLTTQLVNGTGPDGANNPSEHHAAIACDNLETGSGPTFKDDYYLPSAQELNLVYDELRVIDPDTSPADDISDTFGFEVSGDFPQSFYWSSSENFNNFAWLQRFSDGIQATLSKNLTVSVRCVRRD